LIEVADDLSLAIDKGVEKIEITIFMSSVEKRVRKIRPKSPDSFRYSWSYNYEMAKCPFFYGV